MLLQEPVNLDLICFVSFAEGTIQYFKILRNLLTPPPPSHTFEVETFQIDDLQYLPTSEYLASDWMIWWETEIFGFDCLGLDTIDYVIMTKADWNFFFII